MFSVFILENIHNNNAPINLEEVSNRLIKLLSIFELEKMEQPQEKYKLYSMLEDDENSINKAKII